MTRLSLLAAFILGAALAVSLLGTKWAARQLDRLDEVLFV